MFDFVYYINPGFVLLFLLIGIPSIILMLLKDKNPPLSPWLVLLIGVLVFVGDPYILDKQAKENLQLFNNKQTLYCPSKHGKTFKVSLENGWSKGERVFIKEDNNTLLKVKMQECDTKK